MLKTNIKLKRILNDNIFNCFAVILFFNFNYNAKTESIILNKKIAQINNEVIFKMDLDQTAAQYMAEFNLKNDEAEEQAFKSLIRSKLFLSKASSNIEVDDNYINIEFKNHYKGLIARFGSESKLEKAAGMSLEILKKLIKKSIKERYITNVMRENIVRNTKITLNEISEYINQNKTSLPIHNEQVILLQITKHLKISDEEKTRIKNKFENIRKQLSKGKTFEELAILYSDDEYAPNGGDIAFFWKPNEPFFTEEYRKVAVNLLPVKNSKPPYDTSDIIETSDGMYLIQLLDRVENEYKTRHIFIKAKDTEIQHKKAYEYLEKLKEKIENKQCSFSEGIEQYDKNSKDFKESGFILNKNNNIRFEKTVDNLPFYLNETLYNLTEKKIVGPYNIEKDSINSYKLIQVYKKIPQHKLNLTYDYEEISRLLISKKKNAKIKKWINKIKNESFIKIDDEYKKYCKNLWN